MFFSKVKNHNPKGHATRNVEADSQASSGYSKNFKPSKRHFVLARNGISNSRYCFILCNLQHISKKKPKENLWCHIQSQIDHGLNLVLTFWTARTAIPHDSWLLLRVYQSWPPHTLDSQTRDQSLQVSNFFVMKYQIFWYQTMVPSSPVKSFNSLSSSIKLTTTLQPIPPTVQWYGWKTCTDRQKVNEEGNGNDPYLALLKYRNTPLSDTLGSPAQRLMGRWTKTLLPTSSTLLKPETINPKMVQEELQKQRSK